MKNAPVVGKLTRSHKDFSTGDAAFGLTTTKVSEYLGRRIVSVVIPLMDNRNTPINYLRPTGRDAYVMVTPDSHPSFEIHPPGSFQDQEPNSWRLVAIGDDRWSSETLDTYLEKILQVVRIFM